MDYRIERYKQIRKTGYEIVNTKIMQFTRMCLKTI